MKNQRNFNSSVVSLSKKLHFFSPKTAKYLVLRLFSVRIILFVIIVSSLFGCERSSLKPKGAKKVVEGIVFEDCNGNVSQKKKIYLAYSFSGCFNAGVISKDSTLTDEYGHFKFHYRASVDDGSTTSYFHVLSVSNSSIALQNPSGNIDLYPNEIKMNAIIHLKFRNNYTSSDTFYCQFKPSPHGIVQEPEHIQFFVGPFHDTTLVLNDLRVANVNSSDNGKFHSGVFKWGIGKVRLNSYYTGQDGYFYLTHQPCVTVDTFEYYADPI